MAGVEKIHDGLLAVGRVGLRAISKFQKIVDAVRGISQLGGGAQIFQRIHRSVLMETVLPDQMPREEESQEAAEADPRDSSPFAGPESRGWFPVNHASRIADSPDACKYNRMKTPILLALALLPQLSLQAAATSKPHGQCPEGPVTLYTLADPQGVSVSIMDYGATVVSILAPDRNRHPDDIVLGFDDPAAYAAAKLNFGTMGRYINRIGGGKLTLDGTTYSLTKNAGPNTMHGGKLGFNRHLWKLDGLGDNPPSLRLTRLSPDGEEGFPGNLNVSVTFTLIGSRLRIHYEAATDKATVVNLSNHTLFNLSGPGGGSILDDVAMVNADAFTPVDAGSVPTGEIRKVDGTPWDVRQPVPIRAHIRDFGNQPAGYDFNYVLNPGNGVSLTLAGEVYDPKSGRDLKVLTDQPGVQFYTGNLFDGTLTGKGGVKYTQYCAFSLEAQHFPDTPNHPNFPSTIVRPGAPYEANIEYIFSFR
jgi:aldose 1-epimerase